VAIRRLSIIIDSHIHCAKRFPFETISPLLKNAGIDGACLFAAVEEIYERYDPYFQDTPEWQRKRRDANRHLLGLGKSNENVFPYLFVWNDFDIDELSLGYRGIKWHRHEEEPRYNYDDERCHEMIEKIIELRLPVVFEESYENTMNFINHLAPQATVIIPHLGWLNGGFEFIDASGIWKKDNVYADSALASTYEIEEFIKKYGVDKLIFGSDFPFNYPSYELQKILTLKLSQTDEEKILGLNILRLLRLES